MNNKKHNITSKQLMIFIISSQIGFGILFLPSTLADNVGHDGWISVLLTGIVCTLIIYLLVCFLNKYSDKSIFQINILLYGKILGMIFNLSLFTYLCLLTCIMIRLFIEVVKITVLKLTPPLAISAILFIPTVYISFGGLKILTRFASMLYFPYIVTLIFYLSIYKNSRLTFIMPIGLSGLPLILKGMFLTGFSYLGFELITVVYPYVTDKDNVKKYAVFATIFTTIFFTVMTFMVTILTGEEKLKMVDISLFHVATSIKIPIFERADLLFIMIWFPVMGSAVRTYYYCAYHFLDVVFKIDSKKMPILIFTVFLISLGRIPKDLIQVYKFSNIFGMIGIGVICYLIVSFIFSFINKRGVAIK